MHPGRQLQVKPIPAIRQILKVVPARAETVRATPELLTEEIGGHLVPRPVAAVLWGGMGEKPPTTVRRQAAPA